MTSRRDEIDDLLGLLRDHVEPLAGAAEVGEAVAWAMACASLGDNHLWQDLGLPSRLELSELIGHWFPRLAALNTHNMKWKKFFYKQLCLREQLLICKAPSCGVCSDHSLCFGPEEAATVAAVPVKLLLSERLLDARIEHIEGLRAHNAHAVHATRAGSPEYEAGGACYASGTARLTVSPER